MAVLLLYDSPDDGLLPSHQGHEGREVDVVQTLVDEVEVPSVGKGMPHEDEVPRPVELVIRLQGLVHNRTVLRLQQCLYALLLDVIIDLQGQSRLRDHAKYLLGAIQCRAEPYHHLEPAGVAAILKHLYAFLFPRYHLEPTQFGQLVELVLRHEFMEEVQALLLLHVLLGLVLDLLEEVLEISAIVIHQMVNEGLPPPVNLLLVLLKQLFGLEKFVLLDFLVRVTLLVALSPSATSRTLKNLGTSNILLQTHRITVALEVCHD